MGNFIHIMHNAGFKDVNTWIYGNSFDIAVHFRGYVMINRDPAVIEAHEKWELSEKNNIFIYIKIGTPIYGVT